MQFLFRTAFVLSIPLFIIFVQTFPAVAVDPDSLFLEARDAQFGPQPNLEKAIELQTQIIAADATQKAVILERALAHAAMDEPWLAIRDLNRVIELAPASAYAYFWRGKLYHSVGQAAAGDTDWRQARLLNADLVDSYIEADTFQQEFAVYLQELSMTFDDIPHIAADSLQAEHALLLDSREPAEVAISRIPGATVVGYEAFSPGQLDSLPRDTPIVVYCSVGYRSSEVARRLKKYGFLNVANLKGGIFEWANQGRPLIHAVHFTNQLHTYDKKWGRYVTNPFIQKQW